MKMNGGLLCHSDSEWLEKKKNLYIVPLYEYNDVYQVCNENQEVLFQGSKADCKIYKLKQICDDVIEHANNAGTEVE